MSAALVEKALEIVDPEFHQTVKNGGRKRSKNSLRSNDDDKFTKLVKRGRYIEKIGIFQGEKKLTIFEARKNFKSKETILEENLKKLAQIKEACRIELDTEVTSKIIERGLTKRPIKRRKKAKKEEKSAFTEEDFQRFEEEYAG